MTDIFQITQAALNTLLPIPSGMDIQLDEHGNVPETYLVYTVLPSSPAQHADNVETERFYRVQVSVYTRADLPTMPNVDGAMVAAGFARADERGLPFSQESGHYGWAKDYTILLNQ